jgi:hypothetical protein
VITMVNPLLPVADYEYYLDYTRAKVAIVHESLLKTFAEAAASARYLRGVLIVGTGGQLTPDEPIVGVALRGHPTQISFLVLMRLALFRVSEFRLRRRL